MDIIELVILFAFIVLPLLQAVLQKIGGAGGKRPPPASEKEEEEREESERDWRPPGVTKEASLEPGHRGTAAGSDEGWSAEWGHWPSESLEELSAEEVVTHAEAEEMIERQERLEDDLTTSEAARVTVPVVSMEPLYIDRDRGEQRTPSSGRAPPRTAAIAERREAGPVLPGLRSRSAVRRAIVLAEVLGPPRALQSAERMPDG